MISPADLTLPYPPPQKVYPGPEATLPVGMTTFAPTLLDVIDSHFSRYVASKMDDYFAQQADARMQACLNGCRIVLEHGSGGPGAQELSFNLAKAAAHWRRVAEDTVLGMQLVEVADE